MIAAAQLGTIMGISLEETTAIEAFPTGADPGTPEGNSIRDVISNVNSVGRDAITIIILEMQIRDNSKLVHQIEVGDQKETVMLAGGLGIT